jgi:hypothetical protein
MPVSEMFVSADRARNATAGYGNRVAELEKLFALIVDRDPSNLAFAFASACGLVKRALLAGKADDIARE